MNDIFENRFLRILKENEKGKYYTTSKLFCMWAEDKWIVEKNNYTVIHGIPHIKSIFNYIEILFEDFEDSEITNLCSYKCLFVLIASICSHDIGMQDYYDTKLKIEKNTEDPDDLEYIRKSHPDVIADFFNSLKNKSDIFRYFDPALSRINCNLSADDDFNLNDIIEVILNSSRHISTICGHHNRRINTLPSAIERLMIDHKIFFENDNEKKQLIFLAALLQFGDAMDMSKSRLDYYEFLSEMNAIDKEGILKFSSVHHYKSLQKKLLCYIINDIDHYRENDQINFIFNMSVSPHNLTHNYDDIQKSKEIYMKRLNRDESDCINIIEDIIKKKISVNMSTEAIKADSQKPIIPQELFSVKDLYNGYKKLVDLLYEKLTILKDSCDFLYVKLYSDVNKCYYDGISIIDDFEVSKKIEEYYFHEEDWNLIFDNLNYKYCTSNIRCLLKEPNNFKMYFKYLFNYIKAFKDRKLKSEIYYLIRHGNRTIGFVNLHYKRELNESQIKQKVKFMDKHLSSLGFIMVAYYNEITIPEFIKLFNSFSFISKENRQSLLNLLKLKFTSNPHKIEGVSEVHISEIKKIMWDNNINDFDDISYVILHFNLFKEIVINCLKILKKYTDADISIINNPEQPVIEFIILIHRSLFIPQIDILELTRVYLEAFDLLPSLNSIGYKELEFLAPFKCFFMLHGAKIIPTKESEDFLKLRILFPKKPMMLLSE